MFLVAHEGEVIVAEGRGIADDKVNQQIDVNTQFLIGSVTKQFTAAAVLKSLYEREKAVNPELEELILAQRVAEALHQPLTVTLPAEDPAWCGKPPKWLDSVTLHHLLCHSSGIPNPLYSEVFEANYTSLYEMIELFKDRELDFTPGERWRYSNSGYLLLGLVVEKVSGLPLKEAFSKFFFEPLEMTSTVLLTEGFVPELKAVYPNLARGYGWDIFSEERSLTEQTHYENMVSPQGGGGIMSTVGDLHRWNVALYEKLEVLPKKLLEMITTAQMDVKKNEVYGYGLGVRRNKSTPRYYHRGSIPGYQSGLYYYPKQHITIACLSNVSGRREQFIVMKKELKELFGHIEDLAERTKSENKYIKEHYPLFLKNKKLHNFGGPLIEYLEEQFS